MSNNQRYLNLNNVDHEYQVRPFSIKNNTIDLYLSKMFRSRNKHLQKAFILAIVFCIIYLMYWNKSPGNFSIDPLVYTIVIDAGSTGSRIHVFQLFHDKSKEDSSKNFDIQLVKQELFVKVKPGLSSFADKPDQATESIRPLLDKALKAIPPKYHQRTHISLKATAGLRMISDRLANMILKNIMDLFKQYPFQFNENMDIGIMDGKYEGIYSWVTLNYALKSFSLKDETSTCSLDLGGGSTQITFIPSKPDNSKDVVPFKLDESKYQIYAKSFLGFGLMSARMNMFDQDTFKFLQQDDRIGKDDKFSVCMPSMHSSVWTQQGVNYKVLGPKNAKLNTFENCFKIASKSVKDKIYAPSELSNKNIYAFSFYYDRLKSAGALKENGGQVSLASILSIAMSVCNQTVENMSIDKTDKDYPFLCMDLTFIYTLLSQGLGIPNSKVLNIYNTVNDMEINWALGAAFHMLN